MNAFKAAVIAVVTMGAGSAWAEKPASELLVPVGMSAEVGGGVTGFIDENASNVTNPGGTWTARVSIGTRTLFAGELAYVGGVQEIKTLGVSDKAVLLSNGAEGAFRMSALRGPLQPYAFVGIAWRHYSIENSSYNLSSVSSTDDVGEIPFGLGMSYRHEGFIADMRMTYRQSFATDLIGDTSLNTWGAAAKIGFEF